MSLADFKDQLQDIKKNFQELSVDERSEAEVLLRKLHTMLITKEGEKAAKKRGRHKVLDIPQEGNSDRDSPSIDGSRKPQIEDIFCKVCCRIFFSWVRYLKHCTKHISNTCPLCNDTFSHQKDLCLHLKDMHCVKLSNEMYRCTFCHKVFRKQAIYQVHLQKHLKDISSSSVKANKSSDVQDLNELGKHKCKVCKLDFTCKENLESHFKVNHAHIKSFEQVSCSVCGEAFSEHSHLETHKLVHLEENNVPLECSTCCKMFRAVEDFQKHLECHLESEKEERVSDNNGRPVVCSHCGAQFKYKQGLTRHTEQKHSSSPSYKCRYCNFSCRCKTNLKRHMGLHENDRRFVCELCGSSFNALATLKGHHSYVHSDERKFVCNVCSRGFKGRSGLLRHLRIHKDERPYACDHCTVSYKRMSHLNRHMLSAHKQRMRSNRVQKIRTNGTLSKDKSASTSIVNMLPETDKHLIDDGATSCNEAPSSIHNSDTFLSKPASLSTVEISFTTLEELALNSIPFSIIPSGESGKLQQSANAQIECDISNTLSNEAEKHLQTCLTGAVNVNPNSNVFEPDPTSCISSTDSHEISFNMIDAKGDDEKITLLTPEICMQEWTKDIDASNSRAASPNIDLPGEIIESSGDKLNVGCLTDMNMKTTDLAYNSLAPDALTSALFTANSSTFSQDVGDIPVDSLQPLSESFYPESISSFLTP